MEKLVQRNPIQRFKQGKKIEKFQNPAGPVRYTPGGQPIQDTYPINDYNYLRNNIRFNIFKNIVPFIGVKHLVTQPVQSGRIGMNGQPIVDTNQKQNKKLITEKPYGWKENIREGVRKGVSKGLDNSINKSRKQILNSTIKEGLYKGYSKSLESNTPISFSQAFRQARNSGLKEFTWRGNRYTTETAEEKKARDIKNKVSFQVPVTTETTSQDQDRLNNAKEKVWLGTTFAKQGGSLVSRNPVQRFKQKIFK